MSSDVRTSLTAHMQQYEAQFSDGGDIRWLPYIMYFHPPNYRSHVVNTDSLGFRYTTRGDDRLGVDHCDGLTKVNVLAGSSTVFGIGASSDDNTLASCLNRRQHPQEPPWLNFGGRSHNSTQEVVNFALTKHRLPPIRNIVVFSGFNDLGLARLPVSRHLESGAFFLCNTFFGRLAPDLVSQNGQAARGGLLGRMRRSRPDPTGAAEQPEALYLEEQIELAADLVLRHLDVWQALAVHEGAGLTFVLQPLAGWVRPRGSEEEEVLFAYLDRLGGFSDTYGEILQPLVHQRYAERLRAGCQKAGIHFVDFTPLLAAAIGPDDWVFVDRIHFTDHGHDLAARLLLAHVVGEEP